MAKSIIFGVLSDGSPPHGYYNINKSIEFKGKISFRRHICFKAIFFF
jgi:hypothetical protein